MPFSMVLPAQRADAKTNPCAQKMPPRRALARSWEEATHQAGTIGDMADAVAYFRKVLGKKWKGWENRHHFARSFPSSFQGGQREWVRLYRCVRALDGVDNVNLLVKDLGKPTWREHIAAEQALEFCGRFRQAGHRVEIVKATGVDGRRTPDVRVWLHQRPVTIEFKALHNPEQLEPWDDFIEAVVLGLLSLDHSGAEFYANFLPPALAHVEEVIQALSAIINQKDVNPRDLPQGAGTARYVPDDQDARGWTIPVPVKDELDRVEDKLRSDWIEQLRYVQGPTLLVALVKDLFLVRPERLRDEVNRAAAKLRQILPERKMVGGMLLYEEPFLPPSDLMLHVDQGWRFGRAATEGRVRSTLLVENSNPRVSLTADELDVLIGPNVRW